MRLIDADALTEELWKPEYRTQTRRDFIAVIDTSPPSIDPVHAGNRCYCKECWYYTEWGECKEFGDIMKPDEFCSRGKIKNGLY